MRLPTNLLDGQNAVQAYNGSGALLGSYVYGPRGPELRLDANGNPLFWFLYDGHGNKLGEVTLDGIVNPDGNGNQTTLAKHGVWGEPRNAVPQISPLLYCASLGHPTELNTGLTYMRARYYDPLLGRFVSEDPARDGINWYAYARNIPVGTVDPDGKNPAAIAIGAEGGGLAGWGLYVGWELYYNPANVEADWDKMSSWIVPGIGSGAALGFKAGVTGLASPALGPLVGGTSIAFIAGVQQGYLYAFIADVIDGEWHHE